MFPRNGARARRLASYLRRRLRTAPDRRPQLDGSSFSVLFRKCAIVFTDTADFTERTAHDGILHFLMLLYGVVEGARPVIARARGEILKVEGDSLVLRFDDVIAACRGVEALEAFLQRHNRGRPANERLRFAYGIGYGDVVDIEGDLFGLEVNLASKLGEDLAKPGEALLTPSAGAALDAATLKRVVPYKIVPFAKSALAVQRLRLRRP